MERRRNPRSKRRIPCEFHHQGHRYRGIAVNASPSGLFIPTNASLDPGVELEIVFLGDRLPGVSLRGTVARRRAPPAALASVIRAGLGLRIAESPDAYLEFLGMGRLPREESLEAKQRREHPAEALATPLREAAEPDASESRAEEPAGDGLELAEDEEARAPETLYRSEALLIDDGELDDVCAMLEALGAAPSHGFRSAARLPGAGESGGAPSRCSRSREADVASWVRRRRSRERESRSAFPAG